MSQYFAMTLQTRVENILAFLKILSSMIYQEAQVILDDLLHSR